MNCREIYCHFWNEKVSYHRFTWLKFLFSDVSFNYTEPCFQNATLLNCIPLTRACTMVVYAIWAAYTAAPAMYISDTIAFTCVTGNKSIMIGVRWWNEFFQHPFPIQRAKLSFLRSHKVWNQMNKWLSGWFEIRIPLFYCDMKLRGESLRLLPVWYLVTQYIAFITSVDESMFTIFPFVW